MPTNMPTTISEGYVPGCIGRIAQLHALYYARQSGFGVDFEAKVATELAAFCLSYAPGRDRIWLARDSDVEGSVVIDGSGADQAVAHLRWFIVSDRARGQGLGKDLLGRALAFCDQRGYGRVRLWTFSGLDAARHLYESQGFRLQQQSPGSRWGKVVQEQEFVRAKFGLSEPVARK
jgi:GNAT superfamily N-acetyltransferase